MVGQSERGSTQGSTNTITCPKCGAQGEYGQVTCTNCGVSLKNIPPDNPQRSSKSGQQSSNRLAEQKKVKPRSRNAPNIDTASIAQQKKTQKTGGNKKHGYWSKLDRSEIRRIKYYLFSVQIILIVILILNAMYESIVTDPDKFYLSMGFYFPIGFLLLLILFLIFILSVQGLWFKYIQIKTARSFAKRNKLIKDYRTTAQSVLVVSVVILILLLSFNFLPIVTDALKTEDTFEVNGLEEEDNRFEEQDAFGLTQTSSITVNSNKSVELKLSTQEIMKEIEKGDISFKDYGNHTSKDISLPASGYQLGYTPNKKFYFFIINVGNESVSGKLVIQREISKPFVFNILLFSILFIITSIIWLAYLGVIRKKYEKLHEAKVVELTKHYAVKPYTIDDIFVIYEDGTLINHQTRRIKPMDNDILSGMLTAIKDFVRDAFKAETKGQLHELKYGKLKILIEHGQFAFIAAVVSGKVPKQFRNKMKQTITQINKQYYNELKNYRGDIRRLAGIKNIVNQQLLGAEEESTTFDETSDSAWNNKGVVLTKIGKYNEALDCFDNALKINPGVSNIWLNRGIALVKLNEYEEAMDCFDRALQLDPNNESAKRRRNKCWYKWKLLEAREEQLGTGSRRKQHRKTTADESHYYEDRPKPRMEVIGGGMGGMPPASTPAPASAEYYDEPGYSTAPASEPAPRCPNCNQPLRYVDTYESWYCDPCDRYPYDE